MEWARARSRMRLVSMDSCGLFAPNNRSAQDSMLSKSATFDWDSLCTAVLISSLGFTLGTEFCFLPAVKMTSRMALA